MSELPQSLKGNSKEIKSGHKIQRDNAEQMTSIYIVPKFRRLDTALVRTLQWLDPLFPRSYFFGEEQCVRKL